MVRRASYRRTLLAFYIAGIIVGGGILALPFVAINSGLIPVIMFLVIFAIIFMKIYERVIKSVILTEGITKNKAFGLGLYIDAMRLSGLGKIAILTFTIGLLMYVFPADLIYIIYGAKSINLLAMGNYFSMPLVAIGIILMSIVVYIVSQFRKEQKDLTPIKAMILKIIMMLSIWIFSTALLSLLSFSINLTLFSAILFTFSSIIGEFFPEKFITITKDKNEEIHPRHQSSALLTVFKIFSIISVALMGLLIIVFFGTLSENYVIYTLDPLKLLEPVGVIIFMYIGSGVYNILIYKWIVSDRRESSIILLLGILISLITYVIFTVAIILSVDPSILLLSNRNREHALIALARKLEIVGLNLLSYFVITFAAIFAIISVSVAYLGFTDTLADRISSEIEVDRNHLWILITLVTLFSVIAIEIFDIEDIVVEALGIAGNAGGGLFLMFIPWLLKTYDEKPKQGLAIIFLALIVFINIVDFLNAVSLVGKISNIISTIIVILLGMLTLIERKKQQ
ncbi:MAG: hypothetical protein Q6351_000035 [Candidatus Njordarchaeum guaymaensis]